MKIILSREPSNGKFVLPEIIDSNRRPTLVSYAASLRAYGADEEEIHAALLRANRERCQPPLSSFRELHDLQRIATWAAHRAKSSRKRARSESDVLRIADAEHALEEYPWRGIAAQNARLVARVLLAKMMEDNTASDCVADARSLAEATGLARPTVSRALRKLSGVTRDQRVPVLFYRQATRTVKQHTDGRDPVRYAFLYSIRDNLAGCRNEPCLLSHTSTCLKIAPSTLHDAFRVRGKGLTKSAALVYDNLPVRTQTEVRVRTDLSLRTVKSAFAVLVQEGLIERKEGLWVRTVACLDDVAVRRGSAGAADRQRAEHAHDRKKFGEHLRTPQGSKLKIVQKFAGVTEESVSQPDRPRETSVPQVEGTVVPVVVPDMFINTVMAVFLGAEVVCYGKSAVASSP